MSAEEPDETPVRAEHVEKFLAWYRQRIELSETAASPEWWQNALRTLTLGELRNGIRAYRRFASRLALSPVEFWSLCKGKQTEADIERFRELRRAVLKREGVQR